MSQDNPGSHVSTAAGSQTIFSTSEVETFHADDRSAAFALIGLMVTIFSIGLIGYLGVCYWVG
ncbi:MAG TPA: hypothetical protein VK395_25890 [Gemmataceae bacterium]|nr:hypothetical protein [Gemmataceae bacterium]